jgi:hypothetical protein
MPPRADLSNHRRTRQRTLLFSAILAAVIGLVSSPAAASGAEPVGRASMVLSTKYALKVKLSYANGTISARQRITITNRSGGAIDRVNLSVMPRAFGELTWIGDVTVDRVAAETRWTNNANLQVALGRNVADGASFAIHLRFKLRASSSLSTSLEARFSKANGIMQVSHWFPIVSNGHAMRYPGDSQYTRTAKTIRMELYTDSPSVKVAAPGTVIESGGTTHIFELATARDFAFAVSPTFGRVTGSAGGVAIQVFTTTTAGTTALSVAKAAITKYEAAYGQYQWSRLVVAQSPRSGSGNEYPGIIFLGKGLLANREAIAHEVAHQWWYAMVGNDQMTAPWLDEGIAQFSADLWFGGFQTYDSDRPVDSAVTEFPNVPAPLTSDQPGSYDQTVYFKASKFLSGLRSRMGTMAFFAAMRDLFEANRNGVMTTNEFAKAMRGHGAPSSYLDAFLRL